jgi:hypothetical protein
MDAFGKTIIAIVLGGLLGLLSPPIVELIQRRHRRAELRRSLFIELEGLRLILAANVYNIAANNRAVNRELVELVEPILRSDKVFSESNKAADELGSLRQFTDEQIANVMAAKKPAGALIINEEIEVAAFNYRKTFDRLPQQDHATVVTNVLQSYQNILGLCRPLIDDVNRALSMKK